MSPTAFMLTLGTQQQLKHESFHSIWNDLTAWASFLQHISHRRTSISDWQLNGQLPSCVWHQPDLCAYSFMLQKSAKMIFGLIFGKWRSLLGTRRDDPCVGLPDDSHNSVKPRSDAATWGCRVREDKGSVYVQPPFAKYCFTETSSTTLYRPSARWFFSRIISSRELKKPTLGHGHLKIVLKKSDEVRRVNRGGSSKINWSLICAKWDDHLCF